ncbi:MAG: alpha/beta fold hydrolase [Candidatus Levybacteria bacterium]|nr:alpha/beta fold hydrolase [Candidatus Levybacteria bacterium]MDZ4228036.1 alpha/beta fold hydrolase [Candidatus Levybacteria bacterium]
MEEKVFIKNSRGLKLASIIHYPDKEKEYPAIIILHGFTGYKEEAHLEELARTLVENGFVAIRFDCSGSGESDGTFEKDYLTSNYLKDIKCVYDYLQKLKFINKDRIGIAGHSMGGMLSIIFASIQPEIKACIAISPPTTMVAADWIKGAVEEWERVGWLYEEISRDGSQIKIPFSFIIDANKYDVLDFIKKLKCSFLIILGIIDDVVSPNNTREIFKKAKEKKELVEIKGMGHDYKKNPELIKIVNKKILDFLKKLL